MKFVLPLLLCLFYALPAQAQYWEDEPGEFRVDWGGYLWGVKGGLSLARQDWSGRQTQFAILKHGALFLESIPAGGKFSLYGQLGYHERGTNTGRRMFNVTGGGRVTAPSDKIVFHNVSLGIGGKQVVKYTTLADLYYTIGLRAEYNFATNLDEFEPAGAQGVNFRVDYPINDYQYIRRIVYGASVGAGGIFPLSDAIGAFVEISAHPDVSLQYTQGTIDRLIGGNNPGNPDVIPARDIRNFTIEISVGLRFLRKWRYVD